MYLCFVVVAGLFVLPLKKYSN